MPTLEQTNIILESELEFKPYTETPMDNTQLPAEWVFPADKVAFIKEAIEKLKASNRSDYESGEFDSFNHKQEGRYSAYEEVLQWINPATEYATKLHQEQQVLAAYKKDHKINSELLDKAVDLLEKFKSRHEAGLLPDWFIYDEIKTYLDGK